MPFDPKAAMRVAASDVGVHYVPRDTMLYALGLGFGSDPEALPFVFEGAGLRAMPTLPVVLVPSNTAELGLDMTRLLHGEQRLTVHAPLPADGFLLCDTRTLSVIDKGEGRGAIVNIETKGRSEDGTPLFTVIKSLFARGDGGCGAAPAEPLKVHAIPDRAPDFEHAIVTRSDQALLYRLSGDYNPLHADPAVARRAGFERPILHGLCTYGIAARAILATRCGYDPTRMLAFDARFTAPVLPGETIVTRMWFEDDIVSFICHVPERDVVAIDNGRCLIGSSR